MIVLEIATISEIEFLEFATLSDSETASQFIKRNRSTAVDRGISLQHSVCPRSGGSCRVQQHHGRVCVTPAGGKALRVTPLALTNVSKVLMCGIDAKSDLASIGAVDESLL